MPQFYFDLRENGTFVKDEEGIELADLDAAEREAAEAAADYGRDKLPSCKLGSVTIEVRNEHDHRVLIATVSLRVDRFDPQLH
jgi:hypothetical protein